MFKKKSRKAKDLALKEGVTCEDCIFEALQYAGISPFEQGIDTKVPRLEKYTFLANLVLEHAKHGREKEA